MEGLRQPNAIRAAGHAYRSLMDSLQRFIDECCMVGPNCWAATADLRSEYEAWCKERGETPVGANAFTGKLRELGCEPKTKNREGGRGWKGIGIQGEFTIVNGTGGR